MTRKSITIQELIDLKPSMDNPIELVCDDGDYDGMFSKIKVVAVYRNKICVIAKQDNLYLLEMDDLHHYPSFDQPKKRNLEVFCEVLCLREPAFQTKDKSMLIGQDAKITIVKTEINYPLIPNGRKLIYDHDSKELLAWDEELMK